MKNVLLVIAALAAAWWLLHNAGKILVYAFRMAFTLVLVVALGAYWVFSMVRLGVRYVMHMIAARRTMRTLCVRS